MWLSDPQDQRRYRRFQVPTVATATIDVFTFQCALMDISVGGAMLHNYETPQLGEEVNILIPVLGDLSGCVVRYVPNGFAVEFDTADAHRSDLWAYLSMMDVECVGLQEMRNMLSPSVGPELTREGAHS